MDYNGVGWMEASFIKVQMRFFPLVYEKELLKQHLLLTYLHVINYRASWYSLINFTLKIFVIP